MTLLQRRNRLLGLSALLLVSLLLIFLADFFKLPRTAVYALAAVGVESLLAFYGLVWALKRSNLAFLSVFYGGTLFRLVSIGVAAGVLVALDLPPAVPLLALVSGYFILAMVQLPFLIGSSSPAVSGGGSNGNRGIPRQWPRGMTEKVV